MFSDKKKAVAITVKNNELSITWDEQHESRFPFRDLRAECRCAFCVDEITRERRIGLQDISTDIKIEDWISIDINNPFSKFIPLSIQLYAK